MKPQEISNQKGPIPKQSSSKKSSQRTTIKKSSKTGNNLTENQSSFKKSKNINLENPPNDTQIKHYENMAKEGMNRRVDIFKTKEKVSKLEKDLETKTKKLEKETKKKENFQNYLSKLEQIVKEKTDTDNQQTKNIQSVPSSKNKEVEVSDNKQTENKNEESQNVTEKTEENENNKIKLTICVKVPSLNTNEAKIELETGKIQNPNLNIETNLTNNLTPINYDFKKEGIKIDLKGPELSVNEPNLNLEKPNINIKGPEINKQEKEFNLSGIIPGAIPTKNINAKIDIQKTGDLKIKGSKIDVKQPSLDIKGKDLTIQNPQVNIPDAQLGMPKVEPGKIGIGVDNKIPNVDIDKQKLDLEIEMKKPKLEGPNIGIKGETPNIKMSEPEFNLSGIIPGVSPRNDYEIKGSRRIIGSNMNIGLPEANLKTKKFPNIQYDQEIKGSRRFDVNINKNLNGEIPEINIDKPKVDANLDLKGDINVPKIDKPELKADFNLPKAKDTNIKITGPEINENITGIILGKNEKIDGNIKVKLPETKIEGNIPGFDPNLNIKSPKIDTDKKIDININKPEINIPSGGININGPKK